MKCQILLFWKNKKNITNLSFAELAQRVVMVKTSEYSQSRSFNSYVSLWKKIVFVVKQ